MFLCDKNHEEIVHESHNCPLCEANATISKGDKTISDLENYIATLEQEKAEAADSRDSSQSS